MKEYLSTILGKRKKLLFWLEKNENKKLKSCQNITREDEQEPLVQSAGRARAVPVEKWTKTWKLAIYIWKYWWHALDKPSEETISESSQIKD